MNSKDAMSNGVPDENLTGENAQRVCVAVAGAGRRAAFLQETLLCREDVAWSSLSGEWIAPDARMQHPAAGRPDVVFVAEPAGLCEMSGRFLQAGFHVVLDTGFDSAESIDRLISTANATNRGLQFWMPRQADRDFQQAFKVVASGETGNLRSLRYVLNELGTSMYSARLRDTDRWRDTMDAEEMHRGVLATIGPHVIDQFLQLADRPIEWLHGRLFHGLPEFAELADSDDPVLRVGEIDTGFRMNCGLEGGAVAEIEVDLACATRFSTGWVLQGTHGGFVDGRQTLTVEDGEIYDVPVEAASVDSCANCLETVRAWSSDAARARTSAAHDRAVRTGRIISLIRQSATRNEVLPFVEC